MYLSIIKLSGTAKNHCKIKIIICVFCHHLRVAQIISFWEIVSSVNKILKVFCARDFNYKNKLVVHLGSINSTYLMLARILRIKGCVASALLNFEKTDIEFNQGF